MAVGSQSSSGREVRALSGEDCPATASLHARSLPDSFFARLGERFLRAYHRSFIDSPHAVALVTADGGEVDGFLLAVLAPAAHGAHVLRRWGARLAVLGMLALLARPRLLVVFVRTRAARYLRGLWRRRRRPVVASAPAANGTWAVLSHVAVSSARRKSGAGAALVATLHSRVQESRAAGVVLLTAVEGPGPGFYRRLGYVDEGVVMGADGQPWRRFRWRAT